MNWIERLAKVWNLGNAKLQTRNCGLRFAVYLMLKVSNNDSTNLQGTLILCLRHKICHIVLYPFKLSGLVHISCRIISLTHSLRSSSTISRLVSTKSLSLHLRVRWFILRLWCFSNIKTICLYGRSLYK